jgi:hypothetical protein
MHDIATENIMTLIRVGAFGMTDGTSLRNMSPYKWRKLITAAQQMCVLPYVAQGAQMLNGDSNLSSALTSALDGASEQIQQQAATKYDFSHAQLYNIMTSRRWDGVVNEETSSPVISEETLTLLDIIIANLDDMLNKDVCIHGIITLGTYIRENRDHIDFYKLNKWLTHIGLVQVASFEGSMLIHCFGFTIDELPFVVSYSKSAGRQLLRSVQKVFSPHSFSTATKMNIAMLETISKQFMSAISMVTDIEE